jgi:large subunit ribosomal protein L29
MATKKYIELQDFSDADLLSEIKQTETQFKSLKFDHAIKGLDNPMSLKEVRRDIARLKTEARKRELIALSDADKARRTKIVARRR